MATTTPNIALRKPALTDQFSLANDLNANWDIIDDLFNGKSFTDMVLTSGVGLTVTNTPGSASTAIMLKMTAAGANWAAGSGIIELDSEDADADPLIISSSGIQTLILKRDGSIVWGSGEDVTLQRGAADRLDLLDAFRLTGKIDFASDNAVDIGASGVNRPRTGYFGTSVVVGDSITITGTEIQNVSILEVDYIKGKVIGIEWNQTDDTWQRISRTSEAITLVRSDFDSFFPWAGMRRVNLATTGEINAVYGDDNYINDGTNGRVMVQIPKFYVKSEMIVESAKTKYRWWISDSELAGFKVHPAFNQRVGDPPADYIYLGAYEADFVYDATGAHAEFHSRTGYQPWTGGQIVEVDFDAGNNEPAIGDDVSTPNDANWFIVDYNVTAGAWATNDAAGKLWIRKPGDDTLGWLDNDIITNNTQANQLATCEFTGGTKTALTLNIGDARTYAGNIGTGWGLMNIWTLSAIQMLYLIEYGGADSQTDVGRGIVDKASGTGFDGELTGADSIDTNLASNGTGSGTGTNGLTPIAYRWIENVWGNVWVFVDGYNAVDAEYRIINRDGSGTFADPLVGGNYEASVATPIVADGYMSDIEYEDILKYFLFASAVVGSSSTYIPDYFYAHDAGETNIALAGGNWYGTTLAGIAYLYSYNVAALSYRDVAGRAEFIA